MKRTLDVVVAAAAVAAGWSARQLVRYGVGLLGSACVVVGCSLIYAPAAWLAAGALLLALDRKVPS